MKDKPASPRKRRGRKPGNAQFDALIPAAACTSETRALIDAFVADNPTWSIGMFIRDAVNQALMSNGYKLKGKPPPASN